MTTSGPETVRYVLVNARTGAPVTARLDIVRTPGRRLFGLLGRRWLRGGEGVRYLLDGDAARTQPPRLAVDVAFLACDGTVVQALHSVPSIELARLGGEVHSVIELPAGTLGRLETRAGDVLTIFRSDDR
jgi:uncharacterized membrane protein (UPF0127 family)